MIELDGRMGEGGGQILRSSLTLSAVTGQAFRLHHLRANRKRPGLLHQHLTAVLAARDICAATTTGVELGARELTFTPGPLTAGIYHLDVGTAGSTTLVLQTVLPALGLAGGPSRVTVVGGTHNAMAPPFEFLYRVYGPAMARLGQTLDLRLERHGFYPRGGGRLVARCEPMVPSTPWVLTERGPLLAWQATALVADLPLSIANREVTRIRSALTLPGGTATAMELQHVRGPANVVLVELRFADTAEVVTVYGERGVPAERVAELAVEEALRFLAAEVPVGEHLADQLLVPLALGRGGRFLTLTPSRHFTTNIEVVQRFLPGVRIAVDEAGAGRVMVTVEAGDEKA
jgi:RNA 3'-terminal phosphate cyclase (ATP)